jgi:hypothetical protein
MSYCGICNNHDVTFSKVEGGYHCSGCNEILYDDEMERDNIKKSLEAVKGGKSLGWEIYPNIKGMGKPIDKVIAEYEGKCRALGIKI